MTIRPYLSPSRASRGTLRRVPRGRGRPPAGDAAARRSQAAAIVAAEPGISGAELARRIDVAPSRGVKLLAEIRASVPDLPPAPPVLSGSGRVVRLSEERLARLATLPGDGPLEQIDEALDRAGAPRTEHAAQHSPAPAETLRLATLREELRTARRRTP